MIGIVMLVILIFFLPFLVGFTNIRAAMINSNELYKIADRPEHNFLFYSIPRKNSTYIASQFLCFAVFWALTLIFGAICFAVVHAVRGTDDLSALYHEIAGIVPKIFDNHVRFESRLAALMIVLCVIICPFAFMGAIIWSAGVSQKLFDTERTNLNLVMSVLLIVMTVGETVFIYLLELVIGDALLEIYIDDTLKWASAALFTLTFNAVFFTLHGLKHFNKNLNLE
jgi:hypothetical protein